MQVFKYNFSQYLIKAFVFIIFISAFNYSPKLLAQTNKPNKLREEILQAKAEEDKRAEARRKKFSNVPRRGQTVLKGTDPASQHKDASLIRVVQAWEASYDEKIRPGITLYRGEVIFSHEGSFLHCDSAYLDQTNNAFDAFHNVKIVQGDTLTIYGDYLHYDGNTRMAQVWDNVKMLNKNTTLTTSILYYDRNINLAYYNTGGHIEDGNNILTSIWGQYSPDTKTALFKDKVKMTNPDSHMTTDTLKYNTQSSVADIVGNSLIVYQNETDIYSQLGWYDTQNDRMMLLDRSIVEHHDGKTLVGDTIFYDKKEKYAEAFSDVELNDPKEKVTLTGNFVSYDEVVGTGYATNRALFVDWSSPDSLYLSADKLFTLKDSIESDTTSFRAFNAYKNVRFLRKDIQGMSDSLYYSSRDSIMKMRQLPVVWSEDIQLKSDEIDAFIIGGSVRKVELRKNSIAIQKDTLDYYNQISGKEIIAHIGEDKELYKVDINGNVETIYYPKDENTNEFIGINKTLSSYATAYIEDREIERILLTTASSGTMYPLFMMEKDDLFLRDFHWYEKERPLVLKDVFAKFDRVAPPKRPESKKRPSFPGGSGGGSKDGGSGEETKSRSSQTQQTAGSANINRETQNTNERQNRSAPSKFKME